MRRPRFSLRLFLVFVTAVALFLGLSQTHRRNLLREIQDLETQGATFTFGTSWIDALWLRRPTYAAINVTQDFGGKLKLGASGTNIYDLKDKLDAFGVEQVQLVMNVQNVKLTLDAKRVPGSDEGYYWDFVKSPFSPPGKLPAPLPPPAK